MSKVELTTNLKGEYYRVDLRIKWFFLQTECGAIYCWKNGIPSNVTNQKNKATFSITTFWDCQLYFYVKKLFVSEKTQKSELCHFSKEIYVIKFFRGHTRTYAPAAKFDDINLLWKILGASITFITFFWYFY